MHQQEKYGDGAIDDMQHVFPPESNFENAYISAAGSNSGICTTGRISRMDGTRSFLIFFPLTSFPLSTDTTIPLCRPTRDGAADRPHDCEAYLPE